MSKQCVICDEQGFMYYPFCKKHLEMKTEGKIIKCEDCGKWHFANEQCECKKDTKQIKKSTVIKNTFAKTEDNNKTEDSNKTEDNDKIKCLICQKDSNGKHFCIDCYKKYSNKTITVIIEKCCETKIIDNYGNRAVKTNNGLFVRSKEEKIIFDELYNRNVRVEYEKTFVFKDDDGKIKEIHPDFYLPDYNLYIEHWGYESANDKNYEKTKAYKERIYKQNNCKIAGTTAKDIDDIAAAIDRIFVENDIAIKR